MMGIVISSSPSQLGNFTLLSASYFIVSLVWALLSLVSLMYIAYLGDRKTEVGTLVWTHSIMVAIATVMASGYLTYFGLIGMKFWAF
jgi:hypothetical protein